MAHFLKKIGYILFTPEQQHFIITIVRYYPLLSVKNIHSILLEFIIQKDL